MGWKHRKTPARVAIWLGAALVSVAVIAAPAYASRSNSPARGKSAEAHGKAQPHPANSHAFKPTGPGTWGSPGHIPSTNSDPQGNSPSDPDGATNGGMDKPGEAGGFNADKDGNNGCGNDSDREDDNNGWCGRRPSSAPTAAPSATPTSGGGSSVTPPGEVLGEIVQGPPSVLGVSLSRTGLPILLVLMTGTCMLVFGLLMRRAGARRAMHEYR